MRQPVEVAAQRLRRLARGRELPADGLDLDRLAEHAPADEVAVEGAEALLGVGRREHARHGIAALDQDRAAALLPQQELDQPLDVLAVERGVGRGRRQDARLVREGRPVLPDEGDPQLDAPAGGAHAGRVGAVPQDGGQEAGVEGGAVARLDLEIVRHGEPPRWRVAGRRPRATLADGFGECQDPSDFREVDTMSQVQKEIDEQPEALARLLREGREPAEEIAARVRAFAPRYVVIAARGQLRQRGPLRAVPLRRPQPAAGLPRDAVALHVLRRRRRRSRARWSSASASRASRPTSWPWSSRAVARAPSRSRSRTAPARRSARPRSTPCRSSPARSGRWPPPRPTPRSCARWRC